MRTLLILAAIVVTTTGARAQECRFGTNRPAIDVMTRNVIPGSPKMTCVQETITVQTPSGGRRDIKMWTFQIRK